MAGETTPFALAREWKYAGTPDMIFTLLARIGDELPTYRTEYRETGSERPTIIVRQGPQGGVLGTLTAEELPGNRSLLRIPPYRGAGPAATNHDPDGTLLQAYVDAVISELSSLGFLASSSRFDSHAVLATARRELDSAAEPEALASIGNVLRSAMIALANETYRSHMLPEGATEPNTDDAKQKLRFVLRHYFAGRSERYRTGVEKTIEGCWDIVSAVPHRKAASRDELEAALSLVEGLFDAFSFVVTRT